MKFIEKIIIFTYRFILLFLFMAEMPISGPITTRRLAFIIAFITLLFKYNQLRIYFKYIDRKNIIVSILLLIVCALILGMNQINIMHGGNFEYLEPWYFIYVILYVVVFSLYCLVSTMP